jgi:hypothetical protein
MARPYCRESGDESAGGHEGFVAREGEVSEYSEISE